MRGDYIKDNIKKIFPILAILLLLTCISVVSAANDNQTENIQSYESIESTDYTLSDTAHSINKEYTTITKTGTQSSNTIYVSTKGNDSNTGTKTSPKATIKDAIKSVNNGGTIYLSAGTYNESGIYIDKNINIIGDSTKTTIINSQKKHTMTINAKVHLKAFTIQNAKSNNNGGAIYNKGTLTLEGIKIRTSYSSGYGGAIYNKGTLTATKSSFSSNNANYGGAIYNINKLTLNRCTFSSNKATHISSCIYTNNYMNVYGCNFTNNKNTPVYINQNNRLQSIRTSSFISNSGENGGTIYNKKSVLNITKTYFGSNVATQYGGSIYSTGTLNIKDSTFTSNKAKNGGGIFNSNTLLLDNNSVKNNVATETGGVIYNTGKTTIKNSKFNKNQAKNGGVLYSKTSSVIRLSITDSQFTNNIATKNGGALYIYNQTKMDIRNCAFNSNHENVVYLKTSSTGNLIYNSTLTKNTADIGGAIRNDGGELLLKSNYLSANTATVRGGLLYNNNGKNTLKFNIILNNDKIDVYNKKGSVNANYNWWGSNDKVSNSRAYNSAVSNWIYMTMTSASTIKVNDSVTTVISLNNAYNGNKITSISPELYDIKITVNVKGAGVSKTFNVTRKGYYKFTTKFTQSGTATVTSTISKQQVKNTVTVTSKFLDTKMTGLFVQNIYSVSESIVKQWVNAGITDVFVQSQASKNDTALLRRTISLCKNTNIRVHAWVICFLDEDGEFEINSKKQTMIKNFIKSTVRINGVNGINLDYIRYVGTDPENINSKTITNFVKSVNSIVKGYDKNIILSACVFAEQEHTNTYYGQDYAALSPYLDIMLPMTYKYSYSSGRTWLKEATQYVVNKATSSKVVSVLQTYNNAVKKLSASELEADAKAVMNGGSYGYVLFRYGLISSYPKSAQKL